MDSDAGMRNLSSGLALQRVRSESLVTKAYETIKEAILENRFVAGRELSIEGLAQELGVSSTPVREALARLNADGLMELMPNRKPVVAGITNEEIHQVCEIRKHLEPYVMSILLREISTDQTLKESLIKLKQDIECLLGALSNKDLAPELYEKYIKADHRLQNIMAEGIREGLLRKILELVNNYVFRLRLFPERASENVQVQRMEEVCLEHLAIVNALLDGDMRGVGELVVKHLINGEARTLNTL